MTTDRSLPCGCRPSCGCLCAAHSPSRLDDPCARHSPAAVARWIAGEVAALASLLLLIACVAVWGAVFSVPF